MKTADETGALYPPMKTPRGWFVLYQPDYATPNIFNLHESCRYKQRPPIRQDCGTRLLVSEDLRIALQYMHLSEEKRTDEATGTLYSHVNRHGLVGLTPDKDLDLSGPEGDPIDDRVRQEIERVYDEWSDSLSRTNDGRTDLEGLNRTLITAVERGQRICREWLIKSNSSWIQPFLPRMIQAFRNGIYEKVGDELVAEYRQRGGEESETDIIRKINLFARIYDSEGLSKPDGNRWQDENELWDCWVAFSESEIEAKRLCATLSAVLPRVREELQEELGVEG